VDERVTSLSYARIDILWAGRFDLALMAAEMGLPCCSETPRLDAVQDLLARTSKPSGRLFLRVIQDACSRSVMLGASPEAAEIRRLIEAEAWADAALALAKLELPFWQVRRLVRDGGVWYCALSRWEEPDWLCDAAEAAHPHLCLAILGALVEARRMPASAGTIARTSPGDGAASEPLSLCCDNFG
jgi:hypothetical protein